MDLAVLLCPTVTCSSTCVVGLLFSNIALGDFEFVSVRLVLVSRVKGCVIEQVGVEFKGMGDNVTDSESDNDIAGTSNKILYSK